MSKLIGIYNNKGGVGKTTLTLFLADFLSSLSYVNKDKSKTLARVLVIDFDPQGSCSNAILGLERVIGLKNDKLSLPAALQAKLKQKSAVDLSQYIVTREENTTIKSQKTKLNNLDVLIADEDLIFDLEENLSINDAKSLTNWIKKQLDHKYDFIFVDLPGNLSKRNSFSLIGMFLVDYFIIPTEPNRLNTNAIPSTLKMLDYIKQYRDKNQYKILGFVLNKADRRSKQYRLHKDELAQFANIANCKIYTNILPPTPKLSDAVDDSIEYFTLSDRYNSYYNHVRMLVKEIVQDLLDISKK